MMKQDQCAYLGCTGDLRCHLNSAVSKAALGLIVVIVRILRVMYEHIGLFDKSEKSRFTMLFPFDIRSIDQAATRVFNTIDSSAIQWVTPGQFQHDICVLLHMLLRQRRFVRDGRFALAFAPENMFLPVQGMKRAMRRQFPYIHWKIRLRHEWGYKFFDAVASQSRAQNIDIGAFFKKRAEERESDQVIAMPVRDKK